VDFSCKIWCFFLHLWTLMHVFTKITLFKHVCIKAWLNINQCKIWYIFAIKKFLYKFLFHPNMFILKLYILWHCLHSFAFKSNQGTSLHKFFINAWNGIIQ
jgi:hypothetical protein